MSVLTDKLSMLIYTHNKCKNLHRYYFSRLQKYFPQIRPNVYVCCNEPVFNEKTIIYKDHENYSSHLISVLEKIPSDYVLYNQEDYILFDHVKTANIEKYIKLMDNYENVGFVRLIQSGLNNNERKFLNDFFIVDPNSEYYFSTQATIWRKSILKRLFELSQTKSIFDETSNAPFLKQLNIIGLCPVQKGTAVGSHFNSYDFPYIATAKVKGQWNIQEYAREINELFLEHGSPLN